MLLGSILVEKGSLYALLKRMLEVVCFLMGYKNILSVLVGYKIYLYIFLF